MMDKTELLEIIKKLLKTDTDLDFLLKLPESDLETLVVCIRERYVQLGKSKIANRSYKEVGMNKADLLATLVDKKKYNGKTGNGHS